jgi:cephalosporin hydroxylase
LAQLSDTMFAPHYLSPRVASMLGLSRPIPPWTRSRHMEDNLDMQLKHLLQVLQVEICFNSTYFGIKTVKSPADFWIYKEILFQIKPDIVVEIGNFHGGSTLAIAHFMDNMGEGRVIGIDIDHSNIPEVVRTHPRVSLIQADACEALPAVKEMVKPYPKVMVIEDSSHEYANTMAVMQAYGPLVTPGSYMIVEDSLFYHGIDVGPKPGPYEAIEMFMKGNDQFEIDRTRERFLITTNPKGYLRKREK